jgi:N-formylglutamate amidohydrolase
LSFAELQRGHACTDCGTDYLNTGVEFNRHVTIYGGGSIAHDHRVPIREIHLVPHGGTEIPPEMAQALSVQQQFELAGLIHENSDLGTGSVFRKLATQDETEQGVVVAAFHLSRLLLDANRGHQSEQVPHHPYIGSRDLYGDYADRQAQLLRADALLPWFAQVNQLLAEAPPGCPVYHHHTYDYYSMRPVAWDAAHHQRRPAFQLSWRRPGLDPQDKLVHSVDQGLAPYAQVSQVKAGIEQFLAEVIGLDDPAGDIDFPLRMPLTPYAGTNLGAARTDLRHVAYDVRKDVLNSEERVGLWIEHGPWRVRESVSATG